MKLQQFNGGLNTRQAEHLLAINEGVIYSNVDNEKGSLFPVREKSEAVLAIKEFAHFFNSKGTWVSADTYRDYIEYQDKLYYTEINSTPKVFDGTNDYYLGIKGALNFVSATALIAGDLTGTYQYVYTYYNSIAGVESGPSKVSADITASAERIPLINIVPSTDPQVDTIRLYRVGGTITEFTLVTEFTNGTTTFTDNIVDIAVEGTLLETEEFKQAPLGLKYITEAYSIMFGAVGSKLRFTPIGKFYAWPELYFIEIDTTITGIAPISNGILVFTSKWTYIITGTTKDTFSKYILSKEQGCKVHKSIKEVGSGVVWVSDDGVCTSIGSTVSVLSKIKTGKLDIDVVNSVVHDGVYYVQKADSSILAFDYRYEQIFKELSLGTSRLLVGSDKIYGFNGTNYNELFTSASKKSLHYKSPVFLDGSYTERKTYKKVYVRSEGVVTIIVYIDGVAVNTTVLNTKDTHEISLPQESKEGYSIQFEITGTGAIYELDYSVDKAGPK